MTRTWKAFRKVHCPLIAQIFSTKHVVFISHIQLELQITLPLLMIRIAKITAMSAMGDLRELVSLRRNHVSAIAFMSSQNNTQWLSNPVFYGRMFMRSHRTPFCLGIS